MTKHIKYLVALTVLHAVIFAAGCDADDPPCGDFFAKFRVTDLFLDELRLDDSGTLFGGEPLAESDVVAYDSLVLNIGVDSEGIAHHQVGSFMSAAYACTVLQPTDPVDTVTSIEVYATVQTEPGSFEAEELVTENFDVTSINNESFELLTRESLTQFNQRDNPASLQYFIQLNTAPTEVVNVRYRIVFRFNERSPIGLTTQLMNISP